MTTSTERLSPRFSELDQWSTPDVLKALYEGQLFAVAAVGPALPGLARAADAAALVLARGKGRVVYAGAGTSVRIGVQDGAELPPTFDWPEMRLGFVIAGSERAILTAVEGAEDSQSDAIERVRHIEVGPEDVVIGVAASGTTPFTVAAVTESRSRGALTIGIASNGGTPLLEASEHKILIETGEEVIAGSTRMKAGTAQKIALNLLSTAVMIRLGRVYKGMMVDFRVTNAKLRQRSEAMVARIAACSLEQAAAALAEAQGDVKLAGLLALGADRREAEAALAGSHGNLRLARRALSRAGTKRDRAHHG